MKKSVVKKGEAIKVGVRLTNYGKEDFHIAKGLDHHWNLQFVVTDRTGTRVRYEGDTLILCGMPLQLEHLMALHPGYSYSRARVDDGNLRIQKRGTYSLTAVYDPVPVDAEVRTLIKVLAGRVSSAPIHIVVR